MTYQVPPRWNEDDAATAAALNKYNDALAAVNTLIGETSIYIAMPAISEAHFALVHRFRWLHFLSNGEIVDPTGANSSITLTEQNGTYTVYDLQLVPWLAEGMYYKVTGVTFCAEDFEP